MWAIVKSSALGGIPEWTLDRSLTPRELRLTPFDFTARRSEFAELTATVKESSVMKSKRLLICRNQARPAQGSYGRKAGGSFLFEDKRGGMSHDCHNRVPMQNDIGPRQHHHSNTVPVHYGLRIRRGFGS